jgi:hypothetical protein
MIAGVASGDPAPGGGAMGYNDALSKNKTHAGRRREVRAGPHGPGLLPFGYLGIAGLGPSLPPGELPFLL